MIKITECELLVMKCIWDSKDKLCLSTLVKIVNERFNKDWKPPTVSTFVARLRKKGYLKIERAGYVYHYIVLIPEKNYWKAYIEELLISWCDNDVSLFIKYLIEKRGLTDGEIKDIRELLQTI